MGKFVSSEERVCVICERSFEPASNRQKTCGKDCQDERERREALRRYHEKKNGTFSRQTKANGISTYKKKLAHVELCQRCGSGDNLLVHHRNGNRDENALSNLEKICKRCHQLEHNCRSNLPPPDVVGKKRSEFIKKNRESIFAKDGKFQRISKV